MPRRDLYHDAVVAALQADGWIITDDPLTLPFGETEVYIDLGAETPLAAERDGEKIAVEIKTFLGRSAVNDLQQALGQYNLYQFLLEREEPDRILFLAVPDDAYDEVFDPAVGRDLMARFQVRLIVFSADDQRILRWI